MKFITRKDMIEIICIVVFGLSFELIAISIITNEFGYMVVYSMFAILGLTIHKYNLVNRKWI